MVRSSKAPLKRRYERLLKNQKIRFGKPNKQRDDMAMFLKHLEKEKLAE
jgi:hypothetical protein